MTLVKPTIGQSAWGTVLNNALDYLNTDTSSLLNLSNNIVPTVTNTLTLGTVTNRFASAYIGPGTLYITDQTLGTDAAISVNNGVFNINGVTQAQLPNIKLTTLTFNDNSTMTTAAKPLYNGSFESTAVQVSGGATTANLVTVTGATNSKGISYDSGATNSKITYANAGDYYVNFLGQFKFTGGASNYDVTVWYAKNGAIVSNSAYTFTLTSAQGSQVLANITDIVTLAAGDYLQFYWYTSVAPSAGPNGIYLYSTATGTNPTRPLAPSVNINTYNVG
jgi:hypothetical protein